MLELMFVKNWMRRRTNVPEFYQCFGLSGIGAPDGLALNTLARLRFLQN